jgi:hypothetical protein
MNNNIYLISREAYKTSEYIPVSLIDALMVHHFPSSQELMCYSETHRAYKIKIMDLLVGSIVNWEYNRPPDMARCPDIARAIYNSRVPIDTVMYLSFNNKHNRFEIYDGIHRYTGLKIIMEENSKGCDLITPGEFGSNNDARWLYDQYIIVNIRFNANLGELFEAFKNLNKSQSVPDIYFRDAKRDKKELIEMLANDWYVRYKSHFTSTNNPNTGHTNRNKFIELLDVLYDKYKINEMNKHVLEEVLNTANLKISETLPRKLTKKMLDKCKESGCYLFLYKNDVLENFI